MAARLLRAALLSSGVTSFALGCSSSGDATTGGGGAPDASAAHGSSAHSSTGHTTGSTGGASGGGGVGHGAAAGGGGSGQGGSSSAGGGGGSDTAACDETETSDIDGVTRLCTGFVFDNYSCVGLAMCSAGGPLSEFYNVYGLTPWYGEYGGAVTNQGGTNLPVTPGSDFFGAKYALGQGMSYAGATETICLNSKTKYVALRLVPNSAGTIQLRANPSYELARTISVSTKPGQFLETTPEVVCTQNHGGSTAILISTNGTPATCALEMGKTYFVNFYFGTAGGNNTTDEHCTGGIGASFALGITN